MNISQTPGILEQALAIGTNRKSITVGLPKSCDSNELRFPLTPEGVQILTENGITVLIERHAADSIHYSDDAYSRCGATVCSRNETLGCDIVIHLATLLPRDIDAMRRGILLLSLKQNITSRRDTVIALLNKSIITIALDMVEDEDGNTPFSDVLSEIDGRAAISLAASMLADPISGKGILLGGIAGITPCEVTIIGSDIAACATATSALGAGALVRLFDNNIYRLREAMRLLGHGVSASAMHPRVIASALRTSDVVVYTGTDPMPVIGTELIETMKKGVLIFDISGQKDTIFPSLPTADLASADSLVKARSNSGRIVFKNAGSAVPRSAAMALSNIFLTFFTEITGFNGISNALKLSPGLQCATLTFMGKAVNREIGRIVGIRPVDISIFLTIS